MQQTNALAVDEDGAWDLPPAASMADDPLLGCLLALTRLHNKPVSADTLTAGLPLVDHGLTPALFIRAAQRIGYSAKLVKRPLKDISSLVLPAVLLLHGRQACVLLGIEAGQARILLPESGTGIQDIVPDELAQRCTGHAIFVRPAHRFDARTQDSAVPRAHWFWGVAVKAWPIYAEVLIASVLINLFALVMPLFSMNVYDRVVPNHATETLWALAIGVTMVLTFDLVIRALRGYFIDVAGKKLDVVLSASIFEKVLGMQHAARPASVGAFASNLQEFEAFREFATSATITAAIDLPFVFIFIIAMAWIGGPLAWIPVAAVPLIVGFAMALQMPLVRIVQESSKLASQRQATLIESLVGMETIKVHGAEGAMQRKWEQLLGHIGKHALKSRFLASCVVNFSTWVQQLAYVAVILYGVYLIADDKLTTGALIACTTLIGRALSPLSQVAGLLTRYHQSRDALKSMNRLMNLPSERPADRDFVHRPEIHGAIEFRNVSFRYPEQSHDALSGVSFSIAPGERVAIIGRIGSGKTTLEKLILGLYAPAEGAVLVDGTDLRQLDPAALRRGIGHVPQDITLFYGSVRDNIVLGAPYADDAAVLRAAAIGGVTDFTSRSAQGFDLQVGERGERISGGQRQAIAIARAELMAPPVLLLDEPSSAMDSRTEEQFKARLAAQLDGRTLILISHRASLLSLVNRVIVIEQGRVVADGPKEAVLAALAGGKIHVAAN
ncbi:type I secretion system permease/ATPase [Noviherbaspirillum pedocola]|uniref:Cyclolysin secretion/processing ATP-binding protein CyaB n=1 Tax=Noviherbaspirillum pedocola TaxID=2801341 RepID=A0A934SQX6_9BURK|nr:type I secretion system permease/ATPase [Noviherbaspirillum pedocola]MBK4733834.1 type I secretion system permease/ATPase [Noviherbaspirillum pedocola]